MSQILTDEEIKNIDPDRLAENYARAIEAAILSKLNSAEPVAYCNPNTGMLYYATHTTFDVPESVKAPHFPLFIHPPAPSAIEGLRIIDRGFIYEDGVHTPTLLIGFNTDDFDSRDKLGELLSAARSEE